MSRRWAKVLTELLAQPTAPYREHCVVEFLRRTLTDENIPYFLDPVGNMIVGCASRAEYVRRVRAITHEPLRIFVAHMDHPGFHGVRWLGPRRLQVAWHGGGPTRHLRGATVWIAGADDRRYRGQMQAPYLIPSGRAIASAEIVFDEAPPTPRPSAASLYGGFGFRAPVWRSGKTIYTKAADDLVGVYALLSTARRAVRSPAQRRSFLGIITRAEEVGFIGAIGHFELGWLRSARRPLLCISLETSRTLPGALVGAGPVVRLGDRRTVFEPNAINVLTQIAERVLPGRYQRRIMDGGTCEATAATVYGLPAIGISVPLGNYHNEGYEGGPDCRGPRGPAPEYVHADDIEGMISLCQGLMRPRLPWENSWLKERRNYRKRLRNSTSLLALSSKK